MFWIMRMIYLMHVISVGKLFRGLLASEPIKEQLIKWELSPLRIIVISVPKLFPKKPGSNSTWSGLILVLWISKLDHSWNVMTSSSCVGNSLNVLNAGKTSRPVSLWWVCYLGVLISFMINLFSQFTEQKNTTFGSTAICVSNVFCGATFWRST